METAVKSKFKGLCTTCRYAAGCTFPHFHVKTVEDCLEFETAKPLSGHRHAEEPNGGAGETKSRQKDRIEAMKPQGLCRTCDRMKSCSFEKPDSGVWFCEEYV